MMGADTDGDVLAYLDMAQVVCQDYNHFRNYRLGLC